MTALDPADHASTQARTPRRDPWRIAAVALLPILVLGLLLAALWNPMERLDTVPAAVVNLDEPVEVDGQVVPLGRQLAAGLVSGGAGAPGDAGPDAEPPSGTNYAWEVTDAEGAEAGLANGTYAAVVTIPEDFSAAATSFGGDDPAAARQATIDVTTPPGGRVVDDALAKIVATTAASVMSSTLTETYVENVLVGFSTLAEGIGEAADGAGQLADGAGSAADGAGQLADGAGRLADGAGEASSGASQLASGATQLSGGAAEASSGAAQLAGGASQLAGGSRDAASGASDLADGAGQVADGTAQLAEGISQSADGAERLAGGLRELGAGAGDAVAGADRLADGLGDLRDGTADLPAQTEQSADAVQGLADGLAAYLAYGCGTEPTSAACQQVPDLEELQEGAALLAEGMYAGVGVPADADGRPTGLYALSAGIAQSADGAAALAGAPATTGRGPTGLRALEDGIAQSASGAQQLADGLGRLDGAAGQLATGASGVATGADQLAAGVGELATGASGVASGASGLADGVGRLADGASGVASGASGLADGVGQLGTGAGTLAEGADELAGGVDQLAGGAGDLAEGLDEATEQIPAYSEGERRNLAAVVAEPVAAPGVGDLSTGATGPLFALVALWLGALALLTVLPPVAARVLGSTRGSVRLALEAFRLPALVGLGTGAVVGGVLAVVEDTSVLGGLGAVAVGALASVCFVAVHQGLLGWLGDAGRAISLLVVVLLIGTGVVATVPDVLLGVADLLPTGAARDALVPVVVPGVDGVAGALARLVLWTLAGLALAVGATARARRVRVASLLRASGARAM